MPTHSVCMNTFYFCFKKKEGKRTWVGVEVFYFFNINYILTSPVCETLINKKN